MIARRPYAASLAVGVLVVFAPALATRAEAKTAKKPANATAQCNDGTYSQAKSEQGACSSHGGVKTWYGKESAASAPGQTSPKARSSSARSSSASTTRKPANATAECADGTYSKARTQQGACSSHGGVKTWYGESAAAAPSRASNTSALSRRSSTPKTTAPVPGPVVGGPESVPPVYPPASRTAPANPSESNRPITAPANATARCKDGTYSYSKQHSGTCSRHGGVAEWYK